MAVKLRCPACHKTFRWDVSKGFPEDCQVCGEHIGCDRADDDIVMPSIRTARMAANDQVYRDIEKASEGRAQAAADQVGVPISEMSGLKITDLKSAKNPGEIAAPPLPAHLAGMGSFGGSNGAQYAPQIMSGPEPNAGARARTALHRHHGELTRGHAVSDNPAVETQMPGYMRRG